MMEKKRFVGITIFIAATFCLLLTTIVFAQEELWSELNDKTITLWQQGRYPEAIKVAGEALKVAEKTFGPNHPNVAISLNNLAVVYAGQGKYTEAESLCKQALAINEKALGSDHPSVVTSLDNLGELCADQGKYTEAESLYKRALAIGERVLGPDHPDVAAVLENMTKLYEKTGKKDELERLEERTKKIRSKGKNEVVVLGPGFQKGQKDDSAEVIFKAPPEHVENSSFVKKHGLFKVYELPMDVWAMYDSSFSYKMRGYLIVAPLVNNQKSYQAFYHCLLPGGQSEKLDYFLDAEELDTEMLLKKGILHTVYGDDFIGLEKSMVEFKREGKQMRISNKQGTILKIPIEKDAVLGPLEFYIPWLERCFTQGETEVKVCMYDPAGYLSNKALSLILKRREKIQLNLPGIAIEGPGYEGNEWVYIFNKDGKCTHIKSGITPYIFIKVPDLTKARRQLKDYSTLGQREPMKVLSDVYSAMDSGDFDLVNRSVDIDEISSKLGVSKEILLEILLSGVVLPKTGINPSNFHQALYLNKESVNGDICEIAIAEIESLGQFLGTQLPEEDNITFRFTFKRKNGIWLATNIKGINSKEEFYDEYIAYYNNKIYQLNSLNKIEEALKEVKKATDFATREFGEEDPRVALLLTSYAYLNKQQKNYKEAEKQYKKAIEIYDKHNIKNDNLLRCLYNLRLIYNEQSRKEEADYMINEWKICNEELEKTYVDSAVSK